MDLALFSHSRMKRPRKIKKWIHKPSGSMGILTLDGSMTVTETDSLAMVHLPQLMDRTSGSPEVRIGLIDGPVALDHPDLSQDRIRQITKARRLGCDTANSKACIHGTFVAGVLAGKRGSVCPAICPGCTILVRPIFPEVESGQGLPSTTPEELATAIFEVIEAGAQVINLSLAVEPTSHRAIHVLKEALNLAAKRNVLLIVASGNQGNLSGTILTNHPWVIPVVGCNRLGRPTTESNLGSCIARQGLLAPGEDVTSLGTKVESVILSGTSVAAPFVTGTAALLLSLFPRTTTTAIRFVLTHAPRNRHSVVPPLMNAWASFELLKSNLVLQ